MKPIKIIACILVATLLYSSLGPVSDVYVELSYRAHVEKGKRLSVVIPSYGRIAFSFEVNSPTFPDDYEFEVTADPDNEIRGSNENKTYGQDVSK